jgi:hypothetical protein
MTRTHRAAWSTAAVAALALMLSLLISVVTADAQPTDDPLPTIAFLARSDNPVDALAASAVAGQLGGFVALTAPTVLVEPARRSLLAADPDLVVIAGGLVAISAEVEFEVRNLLPNAVVRRAAGPDRNETAAEIAAFLLQTGAGQPLITGGSVAGHADLRGLLSVDDLIVRNGIDAATLGGAPLGAYLNPPVETLTHRAACAGQSFRPVTSRPTFDGMGNGGLTMVSGPGGGAAEAEEFRCPVDLPDGARLQSVTLRLADHCTGGRIDAIRLRAYTGIGEVINLGGETGVTTNPETPATFTRTFNVLQIATATVDHAVANSYSLELTMTKSPDLCLLGIHNAVVTYQIDRVALP